MPIKADILSHVLSFNLAKIGLKYVLITVSISV